MNKYIELKLDCPVHQSFRVMQVGGMFDVAIEKKLQQEFCVQTPPDVSEDWKIGLLAGPSGSGKSTLAKHLYGSQIYTGYDWSPDKAVVDNFGDMNIKDIVSLLTVVGFSSPPSWIKPYHVLSNGEKFRCDLAQALSSGGLVVFDEYTSVVDRNVAKVCSAAIAKGIKSGKINCRFIAVTCHYDIAEWLEPDWVLDMAAGTAERRLLRRPPVNIDIFRCGTDAWKLFGKHHYLNRSLNPAAKSFVAMWGKEPVAFCGVLPAMGHTGCRRISRIVVLPDYQGIGIGGRFLDAMGSIEKKDGLSLSIVASHPSILNHCKRSPLWRCREVAKSGFVKQTSKSKAFSDKVVRYNRTVSIGRAVASFRYTG
ncbi:hypothetical protein FACS189419_04790 [Planctomycetales bacterium]|nr:hypothetical protein FACS189419_04790 [Planctomycetales bacterium]